MDHPQGKKTTNEMTRSRFTLAAHPHIHVVYGRSLKDIYTKQSAEEPCLGPVDPPYTVRTVREVTTRPRRKTVFRRRARDGARLLSGMLLHANAHAKAQTI